MATPSFVNNGAQSVSASAATLTPVLPASLVVNNLLISICSVSTSGKTITTATAGWTVGGQVSAGNMSAAWAWALDAAGLAAPAWTWSGAAACQASVLQLTGNATTGIIGNINSANANASTTETIASITTTANNSLILAILLASTSQTIPLPTNYTAAVSFGSADGSLRVADGAINVSGGTSDAISVTIASANWVSFGIEIHGTGAAGTDNERASQVVQANLYSYSNTSNIRASQVVQPNLYSYSEPSNIRVTQVVISVLRSVATRPRVKRGGVIG
jgi:hypothetical protein